MRIVRFVICTCSNHYHQAVSYKRFANKRFSQLKDERCWHVCERSPSRRDRGFSRFPTKYSASLTGGLQRLDGERSRTCQHLSSFNRENPLRKPLPATKVVWALGPQVEKRVRNSGIDKGWFPKGWFWRMFPQNENPERGHIRMFPRNEGTFARSPGTKNRNEGTFAKTTLLRNRPFVSSRYS